MPGANDPISALPTATALTGAELVPLVQSGVTSKSTTNDIIALAGVTPSTPTIPSDWKDEVDVATTANIVLSGEQTIDGVLTSASRVLVKNQTLGATNGIYVTAAGAWSRSTDADTSAEVTSGMTTLVLSGTVNANIIYSLVTPDPITLGTTSLTFQGVASSFPAFTGKTVAGTTYSTVLLDSGKRLNLTNAGTKTVTVSRQAVVQHAVNTEIEIFNAGAGLATVAPDAGVTINSFGTVLTIPQYHAMKLKKRANPNTWDITGIGSSGITGTGDLVKATSPTLVTPALGTPSALVLTNATGLPVAGGGTGVATLTAYAPIFGGTTGTGAVQSGTVGTSGQILTSNGAGALPTFQTASFGLTNWTEAVNTSAPNGTVPVVSFTATNAATDVDAVVKAKGAGAIAAQIADNTTTGGNKRGARSTDFQKSRAAATQVASGTDGFIGAGTNNTVGSSNSFVGAGLTNSVSVTSSGIVAGTANTINGGQYCFIGSGNGNTASQNQAAIVGGSSNAASGSNAFVGAGSSNTASGSGASISGGSSNTASGTDSFAAGSFSTASGEHSYAIGQRATTRGIHGAFAHSAGMIAAAGDCQNRKFMLRRQTTDATPTVLTADGTAPGTDDQIVLPNNSVFGFFGTLTVRQAATGDSKSIEFKGSIKRGANAAATALQGTVTQADLGTPDAGATWTVAFTADTTNGCLAVTVTGEASHTLNWNCTVWTTENVF